MKLHFFTFVLAASLCAGCFDSANKAAKGKPKKPADKTQDQGNDVSFQGFVGQLRIAAQRHDKAMLESMMIDDFGYSWEPDPTNEGPFAYWDKNNLWPELIALFNEHWAPHEGYMVVPPQLATNDDYRGYRAGVQQVNGSWKFAYFVSAPPAGH